MGTVKDPDPGPEPSSLSEETRSDLQTRSLEFAVDAQHNPYLRALQNDRQSLKIWETRRKHFELAQKASEGDAEAALELLTTRGSYEYEGWDYEHVQCAVPFPSEPLDVALTIVVEAIRSAEKRAIRAKATADRVQEKDRQEKALNRALQADNKAKVLRGILRDICRATAHALPENEKD